MIYKHHLVASLAVALLAQSALAETRSTAFGNGEDVILRRGIANPTDNGALLLVKNQSGDPENVNNDRIVLMSIDLSGLAPITEATLRFQTVRTTPATNTFLAGETLMLYGVKDLAVGETFSPGSITWAASPFLTGTDSATNPRPAGDTLANNVNDVHPDLSFLASFTFPTQSTAGMFVDFNSPALTSFLQADTNDISTFLVTAMQTNAGQTSIISNSDTGTEGGFSPPTLRTNTDVVNTDFVAPAGTGLEDFHVIRNNYLAGTSFAQGDANFDGIVNHLDFFLWRTEFAALGGVFDGLLVVPEPSAGALGLMLLLSTLRVRRGSKR